MWLRRYGKLEVVWLSCLLAPADGVVVEFYFQPGDLVDGGSELVNFEAAESD